MSSAKKIAAADLPEAAPTNHGKTPAAIVTNTGITVGALGAGVGFALWDMLWVWIGGGVIAAALVVGAAMKAMGKGQTR